MLHNNEFKLPDDKLGKKIKELRSYIQDITKNKKASISQIRKVYDKMHNDICAILRKNRDVTSAMLFKVEMADILIEINRYAPILEPKQGALNLTNAILLAYDDAISDTPNLVIARIKRATYCIRQFNSSSQAHEEIDSILNNPCIDIISSSYFAITNQTLQVAIKEYLDVIKSGFKKSYLENKHADNLLNCERTIKLIQKYNYLLPDESTKQLLAHIYFYALMSQKKLALPLTKKYYDEIQALNIHPYNEQSKIKFANLTFAETTSIKEQEKSDSPILDDSKASKDVELAPEDETLIHNKIYQVIKPLLQQSKSNLILTSSDIDKIKSSMSDLATYITQNIKDNNKTLGIFYSFLSTIFMDEYIKARKKANIAVMNILADHFIPANNQALSLLPNFCYNQLQRGIYHTSVGEYEQANKHFNFIIVSTELSYGEKTHFIQIQPKQTAQYFEEYILKDLAILTLDLIKQKNYELTINIATTIIQLINKLLSLFEPDFQIGIKHHLAYAYYNRCIAHNKLGNNIQRNQDIDEVTKLNFEPFVSIIKKQITVATKPATPSTQPVYSSPKVSREEDEQKRQAKNPNKKEKRRANQMLKNLRKEQEIALRNEAAELAQHQEQLAKQAAAEAKAAELAKHQEQLAKQAAAEASAAELAKQNETSTQRKLTALFDANKKIIEITPEDKQQATNVINILNTNNLNNQTTLLTIKNFIQKFIINTAIHNERLPKITILTKGLELQEITEKALHVLLQFRHSHPQLKITAEKQLNTFIKALLQRTIDHTDFFKTLELPNQTVLKQWQAIFTLVLQPTPLIPEIKRTPQPIYAPISEPTFPFNSNQTMKSHLFYPVYCGYCLQSLPPMQIVEQPDAINQHQPSASITQTPFKPYRS
jgi:hypothetical protein